jgi:hypothetical protein
MPDWPVNHNVPRGSNTAVFRFVDGWSTGSGNRRTCRVDGSTRTIAFKPPSVIHGAPSGPTITPWGAEPSPRSTSSTRRFSGSRWPSLPAFCAVYQIVPSDATATSCGCDPEGTSYSCTAAGADLAGVLVVAVSRFADFPSPSPDEQATASPRATAATPRARVVMPGASRTSSGPPGTPRMRRRRCSAGPCR